MPFIARVSIAPIAIIAIALLLGEPSRMAAMKLPITPGWNSDVIQNMPVISGELQGLMSKAGIRPGDRVLFQNGAFWTEESQGLILQFARDASGSVVEYRSWLPISPIGPQDLIQGLPLERKQIYIKRYLENSKSKSGGWNITYRRPAQCEKISRDLRTVRTVTSVNFSASLCAYTGAK